MSLIAGTHYIPLALLASPSADTATLLHPCPSFSPKRLIYEH